MQDASLRFRPYSLPLQLGREALTESVLAAFDTVSGEAESSGQKILGNLLAGKMIDLALDLR